MRAVVMRQLRLAQEQLKIKDDIIKNDQKIIGNLTGWKYGGISGTMMRFGNSMPKDSSRPNIAADASRASVGTAMRSRTWFTEPYDVEPMTPSTR